MTPNALRRFALSLPEAHEEPHFERTSFRVKKKIFTTMTPDGEQAMVRVSAPDLVNELLAKHPDVFFSHGTWTIRNGALGVRLAHVDQALMQELVRQAWKDIAPTRPSTAREASRDSPKRPKRTSRKR
jgi:hypothetical protein